MKIKTTFFLFICLTITFFVSGCFGDTSYDINISSQSSQYCDINLNKTSAKKGENIYITYSLDNGYALDYFTVNGDTITGDQFTMPAEDVEICAYVKLATYTVNISLNDNSRGTLMVSDGKNDGGYYYGKNTYNYGDSINIGVEPNAGYYLKNYSDLDLKSRSRTITVTNNTDIIVNLEQGEACKYFGYYIAYHGDINSSNLSCKDGNVTKSIKYTPNAVVTSGTLIFTINNPNTFSYLEFNYGSTKYALYEKNYTEESFNTLLGQDYDNSWIDVYEKNTRCGTIYSTYQPLSLQNIPDSGVLNLDIFDNHNPAWLYYDGTQLQKSSNFVDNGTNAYKYNVIDTDNNDSISIYEYIIFTINDELYYRKNAYVYIVKNANAFYNTSKNFVSEINDISYTLTLSYTAK